MNFVVVDVLKSREKNNGIFWINPPGGRRSQIFIPVHCSIYYASSIAWKEKEPFAIKLDK